MLHLSLQLRRRLGSRYERQPYKDPERGTKVLDYPRIGVAEVAQHGACRDSRQLLYVPSEQQLCSEVEIYHWKELQELTVRQEVGLGDGAEVWS